MARRVRRFSAFTAVDTALPAATETVVATVSGLVSEFPDGHVVLEGTVAVTGAVGTTTVTLRIRRAGVAGALVGEAAVTQDAGAVSVTATVAVEDDFAAGAPPIYVLTATQAGAAGTATQADLLALVT